MLRPSLGIFRNVLLESRPALAQRNVGAGQLRQQFNRQAFRRPTTNPFNLGRKPFSRTYHSSRPRRTQSSSQGAGPGPVESAPLSVSARLKKLSKEYGWAAVGVYLGLSLLDFPFCFLLVRTLGTDKIAAAEKVVVDYVKTVVPESVKERWAKYRDELKTAKKESGNDTASGDGEDWGVKEAEERLQHEASLATQLALAYAIHKSFIFIRVPLTAAVTPKVVKVLRGWGWKIGKQAK